MKALYLFSNWGKFVGKIGGSKLLFTREKLKNKRNQLEGKFREEKR
ncbi:MAG: hypothetical protein KGY74_10455 [Candidatus Cloacimonetes bacterium]|nr:hypothetical protein [Candidatus Cloacimonadota bacterium]